MKIEHAEIGCVWFPFSLLGLLAISLGMIKDEPGAIFLGVFMFVVMLAALYQEYGHRF